jgi:hypothetical protein
MSTTESSTNGTSPAVAIADEFEPVLPDMFIAESGPLSAEILAQLDVLDPSRIATRQGPGGRVFSYLEGAEVIDTANRIFGRGNWGYELLGMTVEGTTYTAHIRLTVKGCLPFADIGISVAACKSGDQPTPDAIETAKKGAVTDGVKRCLKNFGAAFGLTLYFKDASLPGANGQNGTNGHAPATNGNGASSANGAGPSVSPAPNGNGTETSVVPACPKCGGPMWDNRASKRNPKAPDFKCKDKNCEGALWPPKQSPSSPF